MHAFISDQQTRRCLILMEGVTFVGEKAFKKEEEITGKEMSAPRWSLVRGEVVADGLGPSEGEHLNHILSLHCLLSFLLTFEFTEGRSCVSAVPKTRV